MKQEERILSEARKRQNNTTDVESGNPPPLPNSSPPVATPPPAPSSQPGTTRLDMLLGNNTANLRSKAETPTKNKKVSFMAEEESVSKFEYISEDEEEGEKYGDDDIAEFDDNDNNISQENMKRLNAKEDPNAFINEAENLLNSSEMTLGIKRLDLSAGPTGHTPSVIGTQEVYRDPRSRMLLEQQERKLSAGKPTDGAKLSFQEKLKKFSQEMGDNTPREKAKISKAQREIDN